MINLEPFERETVILTSDGDKTYDLYTCQQKIMNKMKKIGVEPYKIQKDSEDNIISCTYKLGYKQISFRKIADEPTEEQAEQRRLKGFKLAEASAKSRQNQIKDVD